MMKKRTNVFYALLVVMCLGLSACTTAGDNASEFFSQVGTKVSILMSSSSSDSSDSDSTEAEEADSDTTPLDAPGDFTVDEDGSYSFTGVEDADYYLLYMYDVNAESDTYTYLSSNIEEDGSGTYSGNLSDSISYAYGDYRVEAVAYPSVSDEEHGTSEASEAELYVSGEVTEPTFNFVWSCFTQELDVSLDNASDYSLTAYPTSITVTLTNEEDSGDVVTATLEDVSGESSTVAVTGVTLEATYDVSVDVAWDENFVTNASASSELGSVVVSETANAASDNYTYSTGIYSYMDYPLMAYDFDVTEGGELARYTIASSGGDMMFGGSQSTATEVIYTATPTDAADGDLYTFTWTAVNDDGSSLRSSDWGSLDEATGTLHIYEDGTFMMESDAAYIYTDQISSANQYHDASSVEGIWVDNGDGTITLAFDLTTEQDLGYEDAEQ